MSESTPNLATQPGDELLLELADDYLRRCRTGEEPSMDEYVAKHPELADRIRELFPAMIAMERPGSSATVDLAPPSERVGVIIGRYKLLERIGEGGFGAVYMAEQQQPVRRKVALKVVKPGMDSRQVLARFEAERQALAIMDHPNIAKVFDGGLSDSGRPYFVMELVRGEPITEFCDRNQFSPRERLELFAQVCHAVQHAHQKGIIHRDIKPTNVLVGMHDTTPVVKVIDFGVAKALGQELTDKTLFTGFAQFLGTPLYMSPEQAGQSVLDVDTRSDIYSLGVLLYELLTGTTPFDKERFKKAAQDEIFRIIREEEPPKPSTRLSSLSIGERAGARVPSSLASIAAQRLTEPTKLTQVVRGELDWLVMKALEKDRTRRYETASGMARDIERYLQDEPVEACPPSASYRFRKFAQRNKGTLVTGMAIIGVLILGTLVSTWQAIRATRAQAEAEAATTREAKLRRHAELREQTIRAQSMVVMGDLEHAEELVRKLPDDFIKNEAGTIAPILRSLAHWHAGEKRWRQSADYYEMLVFGPAKQSASLYDKLVDSAGASPEGAQVLSPPPWSLAYLEFAPLLIELGDLPGYKRLCESGISRYANSTIPNFCEIMLHVTLLAPQHELQTMTLTKWAKFAASKDQFCCHSALALYNYRKRNDEQALFWCRKCLGARPSPGIAARIHILQAMVYLRLNNRDDAEKELAQGREMVEKKFRGRPGVGNYAGNLWADWLIDRILLREADAVFQGRPGPTQ